MAQSKGWEEAKKYVEVAPDVPGAWVRKLVKDGGPKINTTVFPPEQMDWASEATEVKTNTRLDFGQSYAGTTEPDLQQAEGETLFTSELRRLLNSRNMESASNTPDHILAKYLLNSLAAFNAATRERERWYGRKVF